MKLRLLRMKCDIEIGLRFETVCQDRQAGESAVKCLSQTHNSLCMKKQNNGSLNTKSLKNLRKDVRYRIGLVFVTRKTELHKNKTTTTNI